MQDLQKEMEEDILEFVKRIEARWNELRKSLQNKD